MISGPTILTADGVYFSYDHPGEGITLNAIARGLANTCRFAGQCSRFYSVAEHSVWVSRIVPEEHALAGLFHDAAEAFICDMPKPLKEMLPDYKAVEARIEAVVFAALGLDAKLPSEVKHADRVMLATEQRQIMFNHDEWKWTADTPLQGVVIEGLLPQQAYEAFIVRAQELGMWQ
jgi:uncharacterized protein